MKRAAWFLAVFLALCAGCYFLFTHCNLNRGHRVGERLDAFNGVAVFYNGGVNNSAGRNLSEDGYNIGIRYQCVEFVKRYYFQRFQHRMPDAYGHARDFFDHNLPDGALNPRRGLLQFRNGSTQPPREEDLLVLDAIAINPYGHVAIVSQAAPAAVEIIQQNPGPFGHSRESMPLRQENGQWLLGSSRVLGWLRLPPPVMRASLGIMPLELLPPDTK